MWRGRIERYVLIGIGLVVSLAWTIRLNRAGWGAALAPLKDKKLYNMLLLVLSIVLFEGVLARAGAGRAISHELRAASVPVVIVIMLLRFISGFVTGVAIGFVGTSFPIVIELVKAMPGEPNLLAYIALAYGLGHMGQLLSPLHLCHVMSNEYFGTGYAPVYRRIVPAAAVAGSPTILYAMLLTSSWLGT